MPGFFASTIGKIVIVCLAVALVLGAAYEIEKTWSDSISEASNKGDKAGYDRAMKEIGQRDNEKLLAANQKIKALEEAARAAEQKASDNLRTAEGQHAKEMADAQAKNAAALAAGKRRLRDAEGRAAAGCPGDGGGATATAAAPASSGDGGPGCELSGRASDDLRALATRADRVRANLRLCQATVRTYIEECK